MGGPTASFGIWYELLPRVKELVAQYNIRVVRIHTHIGSGSDPTVWQGVAGSSIALVNEFPEVTTLNLGGGYKVGRMSYEYSTDILTVGGTVNHALLPCATVCYPATACYRDFVCYRLPYISLHPKDFSSS